MKPNVADKVQLRNFALIWSGVFTLTVAHQLKRHQDLRPLPIFLAVFFAILAFTYPQILKRLYHYWMLLGEFLGKISSTIILGLIFFIIITPTAVVMRIMHIDLIKKNWNKKSLSYWIERKVQPGSTTHQF